MFKNYISKIMPFVKSCGKYSRSGEATLDNTAHALFTLVPEATNKHRICNIYFFSTTKVVVRTCLSVTFIRPLSVLFSLSESGHRVKNKIRRECFFFVHPHKTTVVSFHIHTHLHFAVYSFTEYSNLQVRHPRCVQQSTEHI